VDGSGHVPGKTGGIKFEMFIFDALGFAERSVTLEVPREEEFSPVKNSAGADSPETARSAMINLYSKWLRNSGKVSSVPDNLVIEISPHYALDEEEFKEKFNPPSRIASPLYLE
jgi:UDP-N-acetylglucosamine/UDP-N-acetylgalactosamine diphosphorylase